MALPRIADASLPRVLSHVVKRLMPQTPQEARNTLADVADLVKRVRVLGLSSTAPLTLPAGVDADLQTAQEALFAALRKLEA